MSQEKPRYISYLLRLWQAGDAGNPVWRASLEDPHTRERKGFANLPALFAFLEAQTEETATHSEESPPES